MPTGFPAEGIYSSIVWDEEDNERNKDKYGVGFEDIESGFARPHVRVVVGGPDDFIALIKVSGMIFEIRCAFDLHLKIFAADVATKDAQENYYENFPETG